MSFAYVPFFAVFMAILAVLVRNLHVQMGTVLSLCCAVWLLSLCVSSVLPIIQYVVSISDSSGFGEYMPYVLKSLCVAFCGHFCAEICKDAGENAIASALESVSKLAIMAICLPLIKEITKTALSYI